MSKVPEKHGPVRTCPKFEELGRMSGIAQMLRERFRELKWSSGRALETELGRLDRGLGVWWHNRPEHAKALASLLNLEVSDLGVSDGLPKHHQFMEFAGFFGMPPLDLRKGHPWDWGGEKRVTDQESERQSSLGSLEEWLRPTPYQFRAPCEMHWLGVGDDLERQVLARSLAAAGHFPVRQVQMLCDAADALESTKPVVVVVEQLDGEADFTALAMRPEGAGLLVIAPDRLPVRTDSQSHDYLSWERMGLAGSQRAVFDLSGAAGGSIRRWEWTRLPDWRWRFLQWLEKHWAYSGKDTLYSAQGVKAWLDHFDPREEWFGSVADVLSICLGFESEKKLPKAHDVKAGSKLLKALQRSQQQFPADVLQDLGMARWRCGALAWHGALPMQAWAELGSGYAGEPDKAGLDAVVQGKTLAERQRAARAFEMRQPQAWVRSGVLKAVGDGYDFQQQSLVKLLVRDALLDAMVKRGWADWAWACFDTQRRGLVDAALDALGEKDLQALSSRVMELDSQSAEFIGASEALFCAVGRRIAQGVEIAEGDVFLPLAHSVINRLSMADVAWSLPAPWTRPVDTHERKLEWITVCWAWSLMPAPPLSMEGNWLFPGWGTVDAAEAPWWLTELWPEKGMEQLSRHWQRFFHVVDEWTKKRDQPLAEVPRLLQVAHLRKAAAGGWPADVAWWQGLWPDEPGEDWRWIDQALIDRFARYSTADAAKHMWPSYARWERQVQHKWGLQYLRPVRRWLMERLPGAWAVEQLDEAGRLYFASCPQTLPQQWRVPLLLSMKEHWNTKPARFLMSYGPSIVDELPELLESESTLAWAAGSLIWTWNAAKACELLKQPNRLGASAWRILFDNCPIGSLSLALDVLRQYPDILERDERIAWAKRNLRNSGALAPELLMLIFELSDEDV